MPGKKIFMPPCPVSAMFYNMETTLELEILQFKA
jgi:hypothetical protein